MRLITKNTLSYLIITLIVFSAGGFIFYFQLKKIMSEEATEILFQKKALLISHVQKTNNIAETISVDELISFKESAFPIKESITDTLLYIATDHETLPYRQLKFNIELAGKNYETTISKPLFESEDLVETITASFVIIAVSLILILLCFNFIFLKSTWKPFFSSLNILNNYEIEKHQEISFERSGTKEFDELSASISKMTKKISTNFQNLKSFTENASHELQTPLAIIKTKTENLLQTQGLSEEQTKQIIEINQTANRLRKLNQTLLLLAKIENNQFTFDQFTDLTEILKNKLKLYEDLINMKSLGLTANISEHIAIKIHPILADVIVSNLLSNAIKYTNENGKINIELNSKTFTISNSGAELLSKGKNLFNRFYKENSTEIPSGTDSTGLGLALVKQVADIQKHGITYSYGNNYHTFTYHF